MPPRPAAASGGNAQRAAAR
ncbi:hypothetical protein NPIL_225361, partial [Nephila pilipes]